MDAAGNDLGAVDGAAAPHRQHAAQLLPAADLDACPHRFNPGVGIHAAQLGKADPVLLQLGQDGAIDPVALDGAAAVDQQHAVGVGADRAAQLKDGVPSKVYGGGYGIGKVFHKSVHSFLLSPRCPGSMCFYKAY